MTPSLADQFTGGVQRPRRRPAARLLHPDATYRDLFDGAHTGHDGFRPLFGRMYAQATGTGGR